jgi:2-iminobutanoate/2-iminopropanoate deaminase
MREIVHTDQAPAAIGPYSQGVGVCKIVFTAMQIALDPETGELIGQDHAAQARRCLENVAAILAAGGGSLPTALKVTVYLTDLAAFGAVNEVYAAFVGDEPPARAVVEVAALPKGALVAIEAVGIQS